MPDTRYQMPDSYFFNTRTLGHEVTQFFYFSISWILVTLRLSVEKSWSMLLVGADADAMAYVKLLCLLRRIFRKHQQSSDHI
jgi:hypothetical protein